MRGEITCFLFGSPGEGEILHRGEKLLITLYTFIKFYITCYVGYFNQYILIIFLFHQTMICKLLSK